MSECLILLSRTTLQLIFFVFLKKKGIYIDKKNRNVPRDFQGLGVRIEDDVLISRDGPVVLSAMCPKSVYDIENLVKQKK